MKKILAATGNMHKLEELRKILTPHNIEVLGSKEIPIPDVVEDGNTFAENAIKKAFETAQATGMTTFADDSGLEVEALDNAPGIYSARYSGENATDRKNLEKLLVNMEGKENRKAHFTCVIALATPEKVIGTARGEIHGHIIDTPKGTEGFGYDPVFVPQGYDKTFAELPGDVKNSMSHRANALKKALEDKLFEQIGE